MRIIRILIGVPLIVVGAYLALVSLVVGCAVQGDAMARGDGLQWLLFSQGLPPSLGTFVVGVVGMLLIGAGWAIASGGRS
jgi:hypothetical protein